MISSVNSLITHIILYDVYKHAAMHQGRVGVCGHCLCPLRLQWGTPHISPTGILPNPKVESHENETVAFGVKKRYVLIWVFIPMLFLSTELALLGKVEIKV